MNQIQILACRATSGYFTLNFRGEESGPISYDSSINVLLSELETMNK